MLPDERVRRKSVKCEVCGFSKKTHPFHVKAAIEDDRREEKEEECIPLKDNEEFERIIPREGHDKSRGESTEEYGNSSFSEIFEFRFPDYERGLEGE